MLERLILIQLGIAIVGAAANVYALHDTLVNFYVLRALRVNSIREQLTTSDVIGEVIRLGAHACVIGPTLLMILRHEQHQILWYNRVALACITVLLVLSSVNQIVTRRKVIAALTVSEEMAARV